MSNWICVVMNCEGKTSDKIHLYQFPTDTSYLKMWCANLKIDDRSLHRKSRVCSLHFDPSCLGAMRLKMGSIPTLNLGHDDKDIFLPKLNCIKRSCVRICSIFGCDNDSRNHVVYRFPKCPIRREAWTKACKLKGNQNIKNLYTCGEHFKPELLRPTKINKNAFPIYNISGVLKDPLDFEHGDDGNSLPQLNRELPENVKECAVVECGKDTIGSDKGSDKGNDEGICLPVLTLNSELPETVKKCAKTVCGNDSTGGDRDHGDEDINLPQLNLELPENVKEFAVVGSDNDSSNSSNRDHDDEDINSPAVLLNGELPQTVERCSFAGCSNASRGRDINLPHLNCKLHENVRKCAVAECGNDSRNCILYSFPTYPIKRQAWIVACNIQNETQKYMYICGKHFKTEDLCGTKLKKDAIPVNGTSEVLDTPDLNNFEVAEVEPQNENDCNSCRKFYKLANHHRACYMALKTEMMEKERKITSLQLELKLLQHSALEQKYFDDFRNVLF